MRSRFGVLIFVEPKQPEVVVALVVGEDQNDVGRRPGGTDGNARWQ